MLFEDSTLLERQADPSLTSSVELGDLEHVVGLIDAALRLALTDLSPKALTGRKVTEKSSFKHLDSICPAMWSPDHLEVVFSTITTAYVDTNHAIYRLLLQEQSFYPPSATPCPTQSHSEHVQSH